MSKLVIPFGAFRAKSEQNIKVSGTQQKCLKLKCKGTAVNLKLDKNNDSIIIKKNYGTDTKEPSIYYSYALQLHVKYGSGTLHVFRDGNSIGSATISGPGPLFLATDYYIAQPVVYGTKLSLCFQSSSSDPLKLRVKSGIVAIAS
jgi:hypothetical protein